MLWAVVAVLVCTPALAQLNCDVNITQGVPWTANETTYNWINMELSTSGGFPSQLPWEVDVVSNGETLSTFGYNASDGSVIDYWRPLVSATSTNLSLVLATDDVAPMVSDLYIGSSNCSLSAPVTVSGSGGIQSGVQPLSVDGIGLRGVHGQPLELHGINWFGFEEPGNTMVDGLWIIPDSLTVDFSTVVYRLKLLGFNAVRLPFSFENLFGGVPPKSFTQSCNTLTQSAIVTATTDPSVTASGQPPLLSNPSTQTPGICNSDLPNSSVFDRFLYVIRFFARNGLYVMIDNHLNLDPTAVQDPIKWAQYWGQLATAISQDPDTAAYVMMDILNEPDSQKLRWEPINGLPGVGDLYLAGMQAIYDVNPNFLLLIEGVGQIGTALCWWVIEIFCLFHYELIIGQKR